VVHQGQDIHGCGNIRKIDSVIEYERSIWKLIQLSLDESTQM